MAEFLFEILSEEIPARFQVKAADDLKRLSAEFLKENGIEGGLQTHVTPRRLVLVATDLPIKQDDRIEMRKGPKVGAPDKAIDGFCRGANVSRETLITEDTPKGQFYMAKIEHKGQPTATVLQSLMGHVLENFPWPKSMRSGTGTARWVRPIKSILAVFDGQVVPFTHDGIATGNVTRGHRFMGNGNPITVDGFRKYTDGLHDQGVVLDRAQRKATITDGIATTLNDADLAVVDDPGLLEEVTGLVEWPVVVMGDMSPGFLELPNEIVRTTMRSHQKYFSVQDKTTGKLAPHFITVANIAATDGGKEIAKGNARVLTARLNDAAYFWHKDITIPLAQQIDGLRRVTFAGDTTMHARTSWIERLAPAIAKSIGAEDEKVIRAAQMSKADLLTGTVGEFPELQGTIGRYIATFQGHDPEVCDALRDQYRPGGQGDATMPKVSAAVSLAEKMTHLAYFFATDQKPTGSKDPFALRRAAIGVLRIILENDLRLSLNGLIAAGHVAAPDPQQWQAAAFALQSFFMDRLRVHWRDQGFAHDHIAAVLATEDDDLVRLQARLVALAEFIDTDDGQNLTAGAKRAMNILAAEEKKDGEVGHDITADILKTDADQKLFAAIMDAEPALDTALKAEDFKGAMTVLSGLRAPIDQFFEAVMVNDPDADIRQNRLKLLSRLRSLLYRVADFDAISG